MLVQIGLYFIIEQVEYVYFQTFMMNYTIVVDNLHYLTYIGFWTLKFKNQKLANV